MFLAKVGGGGLRLAVGSRQKIVGGGDDCPLTPLWSMTVEITLLEALAKRDQ